MTAAVVLVSADFKTPHKFVPEDQTNFVLRACDVPSGAISHMMQKWHNADIPSATNVTFPFTTSEDTKKEVLHAQDWWSAWKGWTEAEQFRANGGTTTVRICVCDVIQMMQSYSVEIPNIGAKSCSIVCTDPCFHLPTPTK